MGFGDILSKLCCLFSLLGSYNDSPIVVVLLLLMFLKKEINSFIQQVNMLQRISISNRPECCLFKPQRILKKRISFRILLNIKKHNCYILIIARMCLSYTHVQLITKSAYSNHFYVTKTGVMTAKNSAHTNTLHFKTFKNKKVILNCNNIYNITFFCIN